MALTPNPQFLVEPDWLAARLDDPRLRILDCTVWMTPQPVGASICRTGRPEWEAGHIPGAGYVSMVDDLGSRGGPTPYTLPAHADLVETLRGLGIDDDSTIVLYGAGYPATVTRVFWVLRVSGVRDVRILNGGWEGWVAGGYPVSTEVPPPRRGSFSGERRPEMLACLADVKAALDDPAVCLLNALSAEQFRATGGAHYGRPGRIPRSVNLPLRSLFDAATGRFHDLDRLRALVAATGALDSPRVITYCGGGIAASGTFFVLSLLGYDRVALYDCSLLEWSQDPSLPMVVGD